MVEGGSEAGRGHGKPMLVLAPAFVGFRERIEISSYIGTPWLILVVVEGGAEGGRGHGKPIRVLAPAFAGFRESGLAPRKQRNFHDNWPVFARDCSWGGESG